MSEGNLRGEIYEGVGYVGLELRKENSLGWCRHQYVEDMGVENIRERIDCIALERRTWTET